MPQDIAALPAGQGDIEPKPTPSDQTKDGDTTLRHVPQKTLIMRILTGFGFATIAILGIFLPEINGLPFVIGVSVLSVLAASEFYSAVRRQGGDPSEALGYVACILFELGAWERGGNRLDSFLQAFLTMLVLIMLLVELVKPKHKPILNIGATLLGAIYCGWLLSYLVLIHNFRLLAHPLLAGTTPGEWLVLMVVATTSFGDVGGYVFGTLIGRHKLAPSISPSKTWEGAFGSILGSALFAVILGKLIDFPAQYAIPFGMLLGAVGLVGDLCESALKRDLGVKDFGVILPGHGGMLDRLDSLLFTAPVAYYFFMFMLKAHH